MAPLPSAPHMPVWRPSCRRHTPSRRGTLDAELVRRSDVAACVAPLPTTPHTPLQLPKTYCETIRLGLSRFASLYVWRRCHGRHTSMCGADATAATQRASPKRLRTYRPEPLDVFDPILDISWHVWRRCRGRHTVQCDATVKGATHSLVLKI